MEHPVSAIGPALVTYGVDVRRALQTLDYT